MSQKEIMDLKKELEFRRRQIVKLEQELKIRDERIIELEHSNRKFEDENRQAHTTLVNFDKIVDDRAQKAAVLEKEKFRKLIDEVTAKNEELRRENDRLQIDQKLLKDKENEIEFLTSKLKEVAESQGNTDAFKDIRGEKKDNLALKREVEKLTKDWTLLSNQMQDIMSENRVLREMTGVPENYGFNLQEIKLAEKQKIEEYKGRIRRLEEEVEELEKERVDLRYKLRNLSTLYGEKGLRFHQLTAEQMRMVDEFANNLREGRVELPLNDRSKELLNEIERLKAQLQILESHSFGTKSTDNGLSEQILEQIRLENKELKDLLMKLFSGMTPTTEERATISRHILQLPPVPIPDPMGEFHEGYSYRFGGKLPVAEIWTGEPKRDLSALQLQIVELLEMISRRDEDDKLTAIELEEFRNKLREILLVQEELYKQYSIENLRWKEDRNHLQNQYETALQELREARAQVGVYEDMAKTIQDNSVGSERAKVAEYATRIALLEVNNLRLARKYDCLQSEEKDLRMAYHSFESEHAEKDVLVQKKIGRLKEWRVSATYQLQFLFKQLRQSVQIDRYEAIEHQLDIAQEKLADSIVKEADLYKRLSKYENMERENIQLHEKIRNYDDLKIDMDAELDMVSRRLESYDPSFRLEQAVLRRVVSHLKSKFISPETAFNLFDKNKDGKITKDEFRSALENIGIKLMPAEVTAVLRSIDVDLDNTVKYTEFIRKMKIYGVQSMTEEQQIIQVIYQAVKKLNYTLYDVFCIFDRDGDGQITRKELLDSFTNFDLGLTVNQIEKVMKLIDTNKDGLIEFSEFSKVFERELELKPQEKKAMSADWKDELIARINDTLRKVGMDLYQAFSAFDTNHDGRINRGEFNQTFARMNAGLTREQLDELWNSMNSDRDGYISVAEFITQFKSSTKERDSQILIREAEEAVRNDPEYSYGGGRGDRRLVALYEAREQAAQNKVERYQVRMKNLETSLSEAEKHIEILEAKNIDLTKKYHIMREEDATNKHRLANTVSKAEAEQLKQNNEILQKELAEARAAMNTYKSLVQVSADHVRALQLSIEKRKDEIDTFQRAIREMQADNAEAATVGKLYHQVMVSRWSEASANRKYDSLLNEARNLRAEAFRLENETMEKEKGIYDLQQVLTEKIANYESQIRELKLKSEHNISLDKANEFISQIRDLGEKKSELEDETRRLRGELLDLESKSEEAKIMKNAAEEIYQLIKTGSSDDISDRLVEMAERMSQLRLNELKAKREMGHSKEKEEYYARIHVQDMDNIRTLEQEVARWESVLAKKEEAWRKKDDERQKMLLNPKFQIHTSDGFQPKITPGEVKKKDDDIATLKEQLRIAENTIKIRNEQINHLTAVRNEAERAGTGLTQESRTIFSREELIKITGENEADQLAQAANATIKTLNEMIDNKNAQLERKEAQIQKLQQDLVRAQQESVREAHRLAEELQTRTTGAMANLQGAINASNIRSRPSSSYRPDLDVLLQDRDSRLNYLIGQLKGAEKIKEQNERLLNQLRKELEDTKYELNIEKAKNTGEGYKKELELAKKQLQIKDKELQGLKKSLAELKDDLLKAAETNEVKEKDLREKALRENSDNSVIAQNMAKAQQRIETLTKQMKEAREEINRLKTEKIEVAERETKAKEENKRIVDNQMKKQEMLNKLMKENNELKKRIEEHKEQPVRVQEAPSRYTANQTADIKQLRETIANLEKEKNKMANQLEKLNTKAKPIEIEPAMENFIRRFGNMLNNKRMTLEMLADGLKKIAVGVFRRNLNDKRVGLSEEETNLLIQFSQQFAAAAMKTREGGEEPGIAIKKLDKAIKNVIASPIKSVRPSEIESKKANDTRPQASLESQRDERKFEMLNKQISMLKAELETKEKQIAHFEGLTRKLEQEKQEISKRIEIPAEKIQEPVTFSQISEMEAMRKELFELQQQNMALQKRIQVTIQSECKKLQHDNHILHEENKHFKVENMSLQSQLEKLRAGKIKSVEGLREDEVYELNMKVKRLEEVLEEISKKELEEAEKLLEVEAENLDMKFEKETLSLQLARLQRRIKELEQFKNAVIKEGLKVKDEEPQTVKFADVGEAEVRSTFMEGPTRSTKELEQVIDSLRNVIDKLRAENDLLKRTMMATPKEEERAKNEKVLTMKVTNLEEEVKELRLREDINRDLEQKLKRVNEANETLRKDMEKEIHLMDEADKKYRSLFMQYELLQRDNDRLRRALDELTYR
ncbi:unnamed protein product [Blepharisma stoltei]|uniref:EF-hand domain-containing protein n=1 Tax=Blepharisma stoltei TaxID=1481888 RepID=A0AAU9JPZ5_9CILI|nr:unnamed protein product [Blepharisma stoltei]